jgi:hypothetical protein
VWRGRATLAERTFVTQIKVTCAVARALQDLRASLFWVIALQFTAPPSCARPRAAAPDGCQGGAE